MKKIQKNIVCLGGGIMSITLAKLLHELGLNTDITIYEKLSSCALESTQSLNNAGTGHRSEARREGKEGRSGWSPDP